MIKTFIIAAISLDGFIAKNAEDTSTSWTSGADKKFFKERTKQSGVVIMGSTTYSTIGRPLKDRLNIVYSSKITNLEGVELTMKKPADLLSDLETRGYKEVAICGGASIYTMFLEANLVDTLYLTIEPKLFGKGVSLLNKLTNVSLTLATTKHLSKDVLLLEYKVDRSHP